MKSQNTKDADNNHSGSNWPWLIAFAGLLTLLFFIFRPQHQKPPSRPVVADTVSSVTATQPGGELRAGRSSFATVSIPARPAEEIVAEKVSQFARKHQQILAAWATNLNVKVPEDVNRLFAAVQAGRWEETTNLFASLEKYRMSNDREPGIERIWPAIVETYGVAEQAHDWPAQRLLDYGNAILDSLRPGMVYVGGSDAGRFIPTLLNETGDAEAHIVLTQNALADGTYLDYLKFRYGDRLNTLTSDDSQTAFQTYIADAQKRVMHDQQFPNESPQLGPGEDIRITDNRVQVSGQVAVMLINEKLVQTLLQKNPNLSFALEESTPLKSLYAGATPLGPITELNTDTAANPLTAERAAQSIDYWRSNTQNLITDTDNSASIAPRDAYAKLILGQANLFLDHNLASEAEQAYQLANSLSPAQPEAVFGYVNVLRKQNRLSEARQILQTAINLAPDNSRFRDLLGQLK